MLKRKVLPDYWHDNQWRDSGSQIQKYKNAKIQKYKFTRVLTDDWDDNQRGDSGSTPASSQEGWPHPSQHQPRHIGDQLH